MLNKSCRKPELLVLVQKHEDQAGRSSALQQYDMCSADARGERMQDAVRAVRSIADGRRAGEAHRERDDIGASIAGP